MPISTVTQYSIRKDNTTYDTIGLSDYIHNYTIDEIKAFVYCGCNIMFMRNETTATHDGIITAHSNGDPMPVTPEANGTGHIDISAGASGVYEYSDGKTATVVWLSFDSGFAAPEYITTNNNTNTLGAKLVTEMPSNKLEYILSTPTARYSGFATAWTENSGFAYIYNITDCTLRYRINDTNTVDGIKPSGGAIVPYVFVTTSNTFCFLRLDTDMCKNLTWYSRGQGWTDSNRTGGGGYVKYNQAGGIDENTMHGYFLNVTAAYNNFTELGGTDRLPIDWHYNEGDFGPNMWYAITTDIPDIIGQLCFNWSPVDGSSYHRCIGTTYYVANLNTANRLISNCGLKFVTDKIYKPIIQDGWVIGYTDNLETVSDLDTWTGNTKHDIAPVPPTPTPPTPESRDNEIDVNMSQFAPSVGFVNYIEMDYETAQHVASAFNAYNQSIWNIGGDLFKNLISYKIFAVYGTHSGTIKNIHIAGHELEYNDAPINGNYIDDMGVVDLGTINVGSKFRFNDWRDFAPYTKIECFVPCCGWCQLPPWVMGRSVTGTMYIDIANGSCKAVIKAGKTPVAEIGGCVAVDVPFSSVATGAKAAGLITAITNGAVSAFNPTPQNLISGSFGILSALNANYTETKGVMGDGSNINGCTQFLIKVTRPASTDTTNGTITDTYKHTKGIPTNKTITLAKGDGFTQITDANITGNMTAREKQMIVDGFRHGLIL